jgi:hypothetical protein
VAPAEKEAALSVPPSFSQRLRSVLVPTSSQILAAVFISLVFLLASQFVPFLTKIGVTPTAIDVTQHQLWSRLEVILRSPVASHAALLAFWATVGLVAYLICWGAYNVLIEARNEVTLNTAYTNRGHWRGPYETLALKAASAVGLAVVLWSLRYGVSFWLALSAGVLTNFTLASVAASVIAVLGLALQLYAVFVFVQLTFTPWYRVLPFTES